jgi:two-component system, OmpR family, phosphate regulon sensor histidine kinase PhoR
MNISIFKKIFFGYALIILAMAGLVLLVSLTQIRGHFTETLEVQLTQKAQLDAPDVEAAVAAGDVARIHSLLRDAAARTPERFTVVDASGMVLADTQADPLRMENHRDRPEFMRALEGEPGAGIRASHTLGVDMLYVAVPLHDHGRIIGALRLALPLEGVRLLTRRLRLRIISVVALLALLSLAGSFFLARHLSGPIRVLSAASKRLAGGDFETRLFLRRGDELQDLADGFNGMAARLEELFRESAFKTRELRQVLDSLQDGLLAVDASGTVTLANPVFSSLAGGPDPVGRPYWEALREPSFTDLIRGALDARSRREGEMVFGERIFWGEATPLGGENGLVVLLHEITQARRLERMKRDFVVNASHELRTPLTAIAGFAETLEDEVGEQQRRYVGIIKRHTRRLTALVQDLLSLAELEERGLRFERSPVAVKPLLQECIAIFEPRAKEKGLALTLEAGDDLPPVPADPFRLEQVFINLIDNALKYTEHGGVTVGAEREEGGRLRIQVRDTGIGIPRAHLERIFERFYVVDKSRSRQTDGTGLGLAIVKHIVALHEGAVTVESTPGQGTVFTLHLPC